VVKMIYHLTNTVQGALCMLELFQKSLGLSIQSGMARKRCVTTAPVLKRG
jgi:hypothetical protein